MNKLSKDLDCYIETTTIGERGQVVIPKEIRSALKLKIGEPLLAMLHNGAVVMMPKKKMSQFVKQLSKHLKI